MADNLGTAVVTGASTGIGAIYADRLAKRGYDVVLVACNKDRLDALASKLQNETGRKITTVSADLAKQEDLLKMERHLHGRN